MTRLERADSLSSNSNAANNYAATRCPLYASRYSLNCDRTGSLGLMAQATTLFPLRSWDCPLGSSAERLATSGQRAAA